MATKKSATTEPHDDFKTMPTTMPTEELEAKPEPIPVAPAPAPAPAPTGYRDLSSDEARRVAKVKADFSDLIGYINALRDSVHDAEVQRMYSVAITNAETASMWAVRAITHRG